MWALGGHSRTKQQHHLWGRRWDNTEQTEILAQRSETHYFFHFRVFFSGEGTFFLCIFNKGTLTNKQSFSSSLPFSFWFLQPVQCTSSKRAPSLVSCQSLTIPCLLHPCILSAQLWAEPQLSGLQCCMHIISGVTQPQRFIHCLSHWLNISGLLCIFYNMHHLLV